MWAQEGAIHSDSEDLGAVMKITASAGYLTSHQSSWHLSLLRITATLCYRVPRLKVPSVFSSSSAAQRHKLLRAPPLSVYLFRRDDIFKFGLVSNTHNIAVSTGRNASRFHGTVLPSLCCDTVASCSWSVIPAPVLTGKGVNPQAVVWHTSQAVWLRRSAVERRATFCQASGIVNSKQSHIGLNGRIITN